MTLPRIGKSDLPHPMLVKIMQASQEILTYEYGHSVIHVKCICLISTKTSHL